MSEDPIAFWSYAHRDDEHEGGRLTELRTRLSGEIRIQTGKETEIFLDRTHITWGQQWKQRIDGSLSSATFLIPVLTPTLLSRPECRREIEQFLERERALGRNDLIMPIYYVNCPSLNTDTTADTDPIAAILKDRQYFDLRNYRHEALTSPDMGRLLTKMTSELVLAISRSSPLPSGGNSKEGQVLTKSRSGGSLKNQTSSLEDGRESASRFLEGPSSVIEPPTTTVDGMHRGNFPSLVEALSKAKPGDRILVRPGLYRGALVIEMPLEIIGLGNRGDVIIESADMNVLRFDATMGRIVNVSLRQIGKNRGSCVKIVQGRLEIDDCDIRSDGPAITIEGGADPLLRRNRIHSLASAGVLISNSRGTLEDNDIVECGSAGVAFFKGANPILRRNRIRNGHKMGVHVWEGGLV